MKRVISFIALLLIVACVKNEVLFSNTKAPISGNATDLKLTPTIKNTNLPSREHPELIFFKGNYWFMGGITPAALGQKVHHNDIWKSKDGVTWTKVTDNAPWGKRTDFNLLEFKGALWIMGGQYKQTGVNTWFNDIWRSEDGEHWKKITDQGPWSKRLAHAVGVFNNKLYLIGGHTPVNWHLNQDIWESEDGKNWKLIGMISDATLGNVQSRQGIDSQSLISFNNQFFLLGGERASSFTAFNWVLNSTNGKDWKLAADNTPWKNINYIYSDFLRPIIFKGNILLITRREDANKRAVLTLYSSKNGKNWKKELDLPKVNNQILLNPRLSVHNNKVQVYASYKIIPGHGIPATQTYLIELKNNS